MYLGIEIGGTKLQLGIGPGDRPLLAELDRFEIAPRSGATGILAQIETAVRALAMRHHLQALGIGFGGPVDTVRGVTLKSHQVADWENFPLVAWCADKFGLPARLQNDCDAAALAEARFGAGQGASPVFYVTVGSGIGGGLVVDNHIYRGHGLGAGEIGHLRPGLDAVAANHTVESIASGWGIAANTRARIASAPDAVGAADLLKRAGRSVEELTARTVADAALAGNELAHQVMNDATKTLGWAIAQAITLVAPQAIVIGGGVSLAEPSVFFEPLSQQIDRYVFPPFAGTYRLSRAALGEEVVVHGALAIAADAQR